MFQKLFTVPPSSLHKTIPHTRVNHDKYMVTERIAYVGRFLSTTKTVCFGTLLIFRKSFWKRILMTFCFAIFSNYIKSKRWFPGTSNWVADYFINTAGVGIAFVSPLLVSSLNEVFMRDWTSKYATSLKESLLAKRKR